MLSKKPHWHRSDALQLWFVMLQMKREAGDNFTI
jgi:hypothetical protein